MTKDVETYIDSLPLKLSKKVKRFISTHSTLEVNDIATVKRIVGIVTLNDKSYWELTQSL